MPVEEQTQEDSTRSLYTGSWQRAGQRLTISGRTVTKLAFLLSRDSSVQINEFVTFSIREVDGTIIVSKEWGLHVDLSQTFTWEEVTFDTPPAIDGEVRIGVEFPFGNSEKLVHTRRILSDVKADEYQWEASNGSYTDRTGWDFTYRYTYSEGGGLGGNNTNMAAKMLAKGFI